MPSRRFVEQLETIQSDMNAPIAAGSSGTGPADPPCVFRRGMIMVSPQDADLLCNADDSPLRDLHARRSDDIERSGLARVRVGEPTDEELMGTGVMEVDAHVGEALHRLGSTFRGRTIPASPVHLIGITNGTVCPADEPWPATAPPSIHGAAVAGPTQRRPRVLVVDTGLVAGFGDLSGLRDVWGDFRLDETDKDGYIREYVGHGTFIASLLGAMAPTADIYVSNAIPRPGATFEDDFGDSLFTAVEAFRQRFAPDDPDAWPDIISLSAGTNLYYDPESGSGRHRNGLLALNNFMQTLKDKATLLVAAAGNNGNSIRFYPAALAEQNDFSEAVVSVGALRENPADGRTCFSDFGPWVKAFAPGERLVADFSAAPRKLHYQHRTFDECQFLPPSDNYPCPCQTPPHDGVATRDSHTRSPLVSVGDFTTTHRAQWSGTSFATPIVAGYIAQRMALDDRADARGVYADLRKTLPKIEVAGETALKVVPDQLSR
ncbi:S8/S53 family peptidase [Actinomadura sp. DC4]|uniref:S8 family peptidase n=1 Tax=Actinomadura sp. DC4 TaxID=3055069 RepID=UPI0025AFE293|nr:S8/S53 family peptidase [Actinomadura sp. DC4]MDN3358981.1 S8/S53 family peptidase [Actinomadura sp. DC4]